MTRSPVHAPSASPLLASQGAAVRRPVIQRKCAECAAKPKGVALGDPEDPLEREADRAAEEMLAQKPSKRGCSTCGAKEPILQRSTATTAPRGDASAPPIVERALRSSAGHALDEQTRGLFEPQLGVDLRDVRVHTGALADQSTKAINAKAYTLGRDIVFGSGRYAPHTHEGQRILGHELTHVVQQGASGQTAIQREGDGGGGSGGGDPGGGGGGGAPGSGGKDPGGGASEPSADPSPATALPTIEIAPNIVEGGLKGAKASFDAQVLGVTDESKVGATSVTATGVELPALDVRSFTPQGSFQGVLLGSGGFSVSFMYDGHMVQSNPVDIEVVEPSISLKADASALKSGDQVDVEVAISGIGDPEQLGSEVVFDGDNIEPIVVPPAAELTPNGHVRAKLEADWGVAMSLSFDYMGERTTGRLVLKEGEFPMVGVDPSSGEIKEIAPNATAEQAYRLNKRMYDELSSEGRIRKGFNLLHGPPEPPPKCDIDCQKGYFDALMFWSIGKVQNQQPDKPDQPDTPDIPEISIGNIPRGPGGRWGCDDVRHNVYPITKGAVCPARVIGYSRGWPNFQAACNAAKQFANAQVPPGCNKRHGNCNGKCKQM